MRFLLIFTFLMFCLNVRSQEIENYIIQNAREIDSSSKDFKGLGFLDSLLENKRIVLLGESSHGTEQFSKTKFQIIRYLHQKLGFNVVLFESPMIAGSYLNIAKDSLSSGQFLKHAIQAFWQTKTIEKLFDFIQSNEIHFGGVDPQFISSVYSSAFYSATLKNYPHISTPLIQLENRIQQGMQAGINSQLKDSISAAYAKIKSLLSELNLSTEQQWIFHMLSINARYYSNLYKGNERDSCMTKNLIYLAEKMYPNEKIIVWAHNSHIDKNATSDVRFMGKLLQDHFKAQLYAVGLFMVNGSTSLNDGKVINVKSPPKNSLESVLSVAGFKITFIETGNTVFDKKMKTLNWGREEQIINPAKSFDAVILVNGVSVPEYLN